MTCILYNESYTYRRKYDLNQHYDETKVECNKTKNKRINDSMFLKIYPCMLNIPVVWKNNPSQVMYVV